MEAIEIFVGTYEEFILGFKVEQPNKAEKKYVLKQSLASRDHSGSIRCAASMGKYVATGGADDRAFVYDIQKRSISHIIIDHAGTINTLAFSPDATHLFAGSDDGSISVTRIGTWATEKIWKNAHKGSAVKYLSIHPTGKLALSIGNDLVLRTWNLIKGRQAYATNLKNKHSLGKMIENVEWSPDGKHFVVTGAKVVELMSVEEAKVVLTVECTSKPHTVCWINETNFLVGLEDGSISLTNLLSNNTQYFKLFTNRIKGIFALSNYLGVITSSGEVAICKITKGKSIEKICSTNIDCRATCITMVENVNEADLTETVTPNIEEPHVDKNVKRSVKPKVVVEVETDAVIETITDNTSTSILKMSSKKRQKSISDVSMELIQSQKKSKPEITEISKLEKKQIEQNDSIISTSHKKNKKHNKHNQSLTIEPQILTEKLSKKLKRKSVM